MTSKEAKYYFIDFANNQGVTTPIHEEMKKIVIDTLEKTNAEKPISNGVVYFCPICKGSLWQNKDESKYCFRCGQAIDWSGIE